MRSLLLTCTLLGVGAASPIHSLLDSLDAYYNGLPVLEDTLLHAPDDRGMERLAARMRKPHFVIGVIGSSVAAGHDNCNYDSYERQLERTLTPIFAAYGKTIEVRNAGQGGECGDSHQNQIWCMRHMIGDDVDSVHYTWTYFEQRDDQKAWHELFVRWALLLPNAPVPFVIDCGVGPPESQPDDLFDAYSKFGFNALYLQRGLAKHLGYKKSWGTVGDGLHNATRYGGDGVVFRNWHPGPLGFQVIADALAKVYAEALLAAVSNHSAPSAPRLTLAQLPTPIACDPKWCATEAPPGCLNLEEPTYGRPQVTVATPDNDPSFPYRALYGPDAKGWTLTRGRASTLIPRARRGEAVCQHLDYCSGYNSVPGEWITFRLPPRGHAILCCGNDKACGARMTALDVRLDGQRVNNGTTVFGKCLQLRLVDGVGTRWLAVRGGADAIKLTHVIAVPPTPGSPARSGSFAGNGATGIA